MFSAPGLPTDVFARLPDDLRLAGLHTPWSRARGGPPLHSFLEGPAFDRAGRLYCVDVCHGRIFRIARDGAWEVFAEYAGHPNGLKIHRDGRIFVADHHLGLLAFDPDTGARAMLADEGPLGRFRGLNDLVFADNGDLYFTDPGESGLDRPDGRAYRRDAAGHIELLCDGLPYPNGLVLAPGQDVLYVAATRSLQVLRLPLHEGRVRRSGVFLQLSGGLAGPDGMAVDAEGGLLVAHEGFGTVWHVSALGEPLARIRSCAGIRTTNVAFGDDDLRTLYVTEAEHGVILRARLPVAGRAMYSHR
ncbi:MAG: SMP-30/gluconolactonase/LRE family protein [Burkholderiales bacterium]